MKNIFLFLFCLPTFIFAQVGIGTSSPNASAKLEVSATNKGFLPPRVTLTGTTDVTTIATPASGLLVYNTATAGTSPNNVTPGFYYYDGSKWQRLITQQPDATVEFSVNSDPNSPGTTFNGTAASKDFVYVSTINNSQWTYNGSTYVTYTPPASTAWYLAGGTNDAGSNKTGSIYRTGNVGIGTANPTTRLEVIGNGSVSNGMLVTAHSNTNSSWKYGFYTTKHYLNAEEPLGLIAGEAAPSSSYVKIGGGYGEVNAATDLEFYTANNTTTTTGTQRMCVKSDGKIGIGTSSPTAVLHVNSSGGAGTGFRLVDGSQGANKVLQSDANGNASWATNVAVTPAVIGVLNGTAADVGQHSSTGGSYIDLPNGKWSVQVTMLALVSGSSMTGQYWLRTFFSKGSDNTTITSDCIGPTLVSGLIQGATSGGFTRYNILSGTLIINNTSGSTQRYYYRTAGFEGFDGGNASTVTLTNFGKSLWGENSIVAYPMN